MKIIKNIILALIILIAILAVIGFLLPRTSSVSRSTVIQAPAEVIFDQVNDLKKNEAWSPWKDPTMQLSYGAITAGKGAVSSWTSKDMGSGSMTIAESNPPTGLNIDLDFGSHGKAKAVWTFVQEGDGVRVTETMLGDAGNNPAKRWMSLMSDKFVGPYFEKGLASLKAVSEGRATELKAEAAAAELALKKAAADSAAAADSLAAAEAAKKPVKGKKHK